MFHHALLSLRTVSAAALSLLLAACGGGGDGNCAVCLAVALMPRPSIPADSPTASPEPAPTVETPAPVPAPSPPDPPAPDPAPPEPPAPEPPAPVPAAPTHAIGGSVTGLAANVKLVLLDNNGDPLTLATDGSFRFAQTVASNAPYSVTVGTQPLWQICSVSDGSGIASADVSSVRVTCASAQPQVSIMAGSGNWGSTDGLGTAASFGQVFALAVDASGNLYIADTGNHLIRKMTPAGAVSTFAGSTTRGSADGDAATARFNLPYGLAVDAQGNVYVADTFNNMIRKITPAGVVTTLAGSTTHGSADGRGAAASFTEPAGVKVGPDGNIYVTDSYNYLIRKITPEGDVTTLAGTRSSGTWTGNGAYPPYAFADGTGAAARFSIPWGLDIDASGCLYVADVANLRVRKITPQGVVTTLAGSGAPGTANGAGAAAQFELPVGVAVNAAGQVYVADLDTIRRITPVP